MSNTKDTEKKTTDRHQVGRLVISERHKEIDKAIQQIINHDTQGVWFKEGFAIVDKKKMLEMEFGDWTFDKSEMLKENVKLKNKLHTIKDTLEEI